MEDFLIRNKSKVSLYSQQTKSYVHIENPKLIRASSAHPFLLSDHQAKSRVSFYIQLAEQGNLIIRNSLARKSISERRISKSGWHTADT